MVGVVKPLLLKYDVLSSWIFWFASEIFDFTSIPEELTPTVLERVEQMNLHQLKVVLLQHNSFSL